MSGLSLQRCYNHGGREAVARCPSCTRFYCRECISEHEGKVLCATCLAATREQKSPGGSGWRMVLRGVQLLAVLFVAWVFFYWVGQGLLSIPTSFHDASVWQSEPTEEP